METYNDYETARAEFEWNLPESFNPAVDFLCKHDTPDSVALRYQPQNLKNSHRETTDVPSYTFEELDELSDRLASGLASLGLKAGDRVGVVIPQKPANPVTHLANWKLGAVSVPLTVLFGRDALQYRLADSDARAVIIDERVLGTLETIREDCPDLEHVIVRRSETDTATSELKTNEDERGNSACGSERDVHSFQALVASHESGFDVYDATPETPSAIMYTSGSTGPPKGVLHSHALWLGRAAAAFNYFEQGLEGATLWTPADWAWGAALGGTLFAGWHYGATVVGWPRNEFDPDQVFKHMARHRVTHAFMPPTALRLLMSVDNPESKYDLSLETLAAAGEPLTPEILNWVRETFEDVSLNEFYGQTELNLCVGNCSQWFDPQPESMGKPLPGYDVTILTPETHEPLPPGEVGEIAVKPGDRRVFFDEYWRLPEKTAGKRTEDGWFLTGDLAKQDDEGYLWFVSRADDVILTRGYRVGPMEVESAILEHPDVEQVGVVGVPHETIGEAIYAFVEPTDSVTHPDSSELVQEPERLREEIRDLVRERLAAYEYPEEVQFVESLPQTSTGKIKRSSLRRYT